MTTGLDYLEDSEKYDSSAVVTRVEDIDGTARIHLDRTIFYPQGGGQPTDKGKIDSDAGHMNVERVSFVDGEVFHDGTLQGSFSTGDAVQLHVDPQRRNLHARLHTGGHLVMTAVDKLLHLPAIKGYHFPDGPYVEFKGSVEVAAREQVLRDLQSSLDEMVEGDTEVVAKLESIERLKELNVFMPAEIPSGKPTRVVVTCGYYSPCGGTHVKRLGSLKGLKVKGIKSKSGNTRVSYYIDNDS